MIKNFKKKSQKVEKCPIKVDKKNTSNTLKITKHYVTHLKIIN